MRTKLLIAVVLMTGYASRGQESGKAFTLKQCIEYAMTNNVSYKNATIDEYIAKSKVNDYIGTGLPQISGTVAVQHADPLRRIFGVGDGNPNFLAGGATIPKGEVFAIPNFFQLANTADASATLTQLLFSSQFFVGLTAAKTYRELAVKNKEVTLVHVVENVTKAYYLALINLERKNLFDINISRVDSLLKQTKALNKSGFAEQLDVNRLEVTYNNLLTEKQKFDNALVLSSILLKYQMTMPLDQELLLSDNISSISIDSTTTIGNKPDYNNRAEYRLLNTQLRLERLSHKANVHAYLPSLVFSANAGVFSQNPKIKFPTDKWYPYATYTLALNVPIFSGFSRLQKVQQAKLAVNKTENNIKQFELTVDVQTKSAYINYKNSIQTLNIQKSNMELAKEVARVTQIKYKSGTGSNIEVINAESSLKEAQVNYYNALYDALVYKVDYDISLGNLK